MSWFSNHSNSRLTLHFASDFIVFSPSETKQLEDINDLYALRADAVSLGLSPATEDEILEFEMEAEEAKIEKEEETKVEEPPVVDPSPADLEKNKDTEDLTPTGTNSSEADTSQEKTPKNKKNKK